MIPHFEISLFKISTYGWNGITILSLETIEDIYSLLHIEYTNNIWKIQILFGLIKIIK